MQNAGNMSRSRQVLSGILTESALCLKKYLQEKNQLKEKLIFVNPWSERRE
jgi:hypothetical protein